MLKALLKKFWNRRKEVLEAYHHDSDDLIQEFIQTPKVQPIERIKVVKSWIESSKIHHRETIEKFIETYAADELEYERMMLMSDKHFSSLEAKEQITFH